MKKRRIIFLFVSVLIFSAQVAVSQQLHNRPAYAAGRFYDASPGKLKADLKLLFSKAKCHHLQHVMALISPHAGYAYSGFVAAESYKQINPDSHYDNIFLIGSSHIMFLGGASVYSAGDYVTPLGKVKVNTEIAKKLINENQYISFIPDAHLHEHSLENQLPFLQYRLKNSFRIVPIIIGTDDKKILQSIAHSLKPYFNKKNLFIISSDFSHYPRYRDAQKADSLTASAIIENKVSAFQKALRHNALQHYPNLVTSACGHTAITTLLYITQNMLNVKIVPLNYMNSADVAIGDKSRVVGYFSLAVVKTQKLKTADSLSIKDKRKLLHIARITIEKYLKNRQIPVLDSNQFDAALKAKSGAFVTLTKNGQLRGCIGRFIAKQPLYKTIQQMALAAATHDYRFQPVIPEELKNISIEISVLTPLKRIKSIDEIVLGRDGIYMEKDDKHGTFLPQVATETGWDKEEFLGHCARDKAGLAWEDWKKAKIYTYRDIVFSEKKCN